MKRALYILCCLFLSLLASSLRAESVNISTADTTNQTLHNLEIFERVSTVLRGEHGAYYRFEDVPMNELVVRVAKEFIGTQYLWASLESVPEKLNVFLDKTDCILFVEMSTCFALTLKGKAIKQSSTDTSFPSVTNAAPTYELLVHNIRNMRYRKGEVTTYSSRVHYTSEWLIQNARNGLMHEFTSELGEVFDQTFSYMSDHPQTYYQLANDTVELARIRERELWLNEQGSYYYISQARLRDPEVMSQIRSGDIITFISPRKGLDLAHVAIAYEQDGEMHFIHASYGAKKVIIEPKTLADYATNGIRITRLHEPLPPYSAKTRDTLHVHPGERIGDAIQKARENYKHHNRYTTVLIDPGTYYEELTVDVPCLQLINSASREKEVQKEQLIAVKDGGVNIGDKVVRISWYCGHGYQYASMGEAFNYGGSRMRRWNASVLVTAPYFYAEGIIFENSFNMYVSEAESMDSMVDITRAEELCGKDMSAYWNEKERPKRLMPERPKTVGSTEVQNRIYRERASAISFTSEAKHCYLKNCRVVGRQDAFYGDHGAEVWVEGGALCGAVDYIFGGMDLAVAGAELVAMTNTEKGDKCYIAAGRGAVEDYLQKLSQEQRDSIPAGEMAEYGMYFENCVVRHATPDELVNPGSDPIWLARPWRWWGAHVFIRTKAAPNVLQPVGERFSLGLTKGHPAPFCAEIDAVVLKTE